MTFVLDTAQNHGNNFSLSVNVRQCSITDSVAPVKVFESHLFVRKVRELAPYWTSSKEKTGERRKNELVQYGASSLTLRQKSSFPPSHKTASYAGYIFCNTAPHSFSHKILNSSELNECQDKRGNLKR